MLVIRLDHQMPIRSRIKKVSKRWVKVKLIKVGMDLGHFRMLWIARVKNNLGMEASLRIRPTGQAPNLAR